MRCGLSTGNLTSIKHTALNFVRNLYLHMIRSYMCVYLSFVSVCVAGYSVVEQHSGVGDGTATFRTDHTIHYEHLCAHEDNPSELIMLYRIHTDIAHTKQRPRVPQHAILNYNTVYYYPYEEYAQWYATCGCLMRTRAYLLLSIHPFGFQYTHLASPYRQFCLALLPIPEVPLAACSNPNTATTTTSPMEFDLFILVVGFNPVV